MIEREDVEGMACPSCGQTKEFQIAATVWGAYTAEGFDTTADGLPSYDNDWDQYDGCRCPFCEKAGCVEDFLT